MSSYIERGIDYIVGYLDLRSSCSYYSLLFLQETQDEAGASQASKDKVHEVNNFRYSYFFSSIFFQASEDEESGEEDTKLHPLEKLQEKTRALPDGTTCPWLQFWKV